MTSREKKRLLSDLESDIQNHIEIETQDNIARGMSPEEARYAAVRKFGNVTRVVEDTREVWAIRWLDHLIQDLRFALRGIRKSPLFATVVVLTLALGIGANTAIFTIIDAVMLRSIPVSNPKQLVVFSWKARKEPDLRGHSSFGDCDDRPRQSVRIDCSLSVPFFQAVRARASDSFSKVAAFSGPITVDFSGYGKPAMARGTYVSGDFFNMLDVPMALGRPIGTDDDTQSASSVIVLDYNYWRVAFASDPNVIGRNVRLNDTAATIVGVTGQAFTNLTPGKSHDFYMPLSLVLRVRSEWWDSGDRLFEPDSFWVVILGRLRPGVSIAQAQAAADTIFRNETIHGSKPLFTAADEPAIKLYSVEKGLQGENVYYTPMLYTMMVAVGIVLLIACANVAGLMLARSAHRQKEMALRIAIGAGPGRILRQLLTESLLLSTIGGALGVLLAVWGVKAIVHFMGGASQDGFPYVIEPNARILAFSVATTFVTSILFGLAPARRCARVDVNPALKESPSSVAKRSTARWLHLGDVLVVAQVALSIVVAVGAGLLVRSLQNLRNIDPGFRTENLLIFGVNPVLAGYTDVQSAQLYPKLKERFAVLPGVTSVSYSNDTLLSGGQSGTDIHFDGAPPDINPIVDQMSVGLDFFATLKIPLLAGRVFTSADLVSAAATENANKAADRASRAAQKSGKAPPRPATQFAGVAPTPVLINRAFARQYFANQNPVGRHFGPSLHNREVDGQPGYLIVGVVGDTKYPSLRRPIEPTMYQPLLNTSAHFELRTAVDPVTLIPAVREVVSAVDSNLPVFEISTQSDRIDRLLSQERLVTRASSFFGVLTLALACFGLYGLLSYEVAWRTRELGIRMALGAQSRDILRLVIKQVVVIVAIGLVAGVAAALGLTRFMSDMLYNVRPNDPATIAGVAALLAVVALAACYLPARRAIHTDPIIALRHE
jgi:macrolide transport system ATP-binding/permease protein